MILIAALLLAQQTSWQSYVRDFDRYVASDSVAGAATVLVEGGRVTQEHYAGYADVSTLRRVDASTLFHWASITKTLTAVAVMQLRDQGLLSLDDPLTRWVPEVRQLHNPFGPTDAITLRMVLGHSAGFRGGTWPYARGRPWEPFEPTRWEQLVAMMPYQETQFAPDARYGYSNPGYVYLARVIEAVSGDPWQGYIYKNVWLPLGITGSYFGLTPWPARMHRSHNYALVRDSATGSLRRVDQGVEFDPGITIPNGGWNGPIGDVARWVAALADYPGIEEFWRARHAVSGYDAGADSMGLGFFLYGTGGERLVGHTGHQANFRSYFLLHPRTRRGIVAVFNTTNDAQPEESERGWRRAMELARRVLQDR